MKTGLLYETTTVIWCIVKNKIRSKYIKKKMHNEIHKQKRGYSLTGKTAILHIVILGSSPNISIQSLI